MGDGETDGLWLSKTAFGGILGILTLETMVLLAVGWVYVRRRRPKPHPVRLGGSGKHFSGRVSAAGSVAPEPAPPRPASSMGSGKHSSFGRGRRSSLFGRRAERSDNRDYVWEVSPKQIQFEKQIGVGSCGKVWLATWLGSPVAVKTFNDDDFSDTEDFVNAVTKEIKLMSMLHHPNIVMFLGACVTPPEMCLLLEYCIHGSLHAFLREEKKHKITIKMDLCVKFNIDIARGVKYLHDRCQIIQRDLKSKNILVDESLNAKVTDFGLSRNKPGGSSSNMTACGTPAWTAPEIIKCKDYTEKVDVYSFGILMWEILTREEPYKRNADLKGIQIAYAAAEQGIRPAVPTYCPEKYSELMKRCWAGNPDQRPDFAEVLDILFAMKKLNKPVPTRRAAPRLCPRTTVGGSPPVLTTARRCAQTADVAHRDEGHRLLRRLESKHEEAAHAGAERCGGHDSGRGSCHRHRELGRR